MTGIVYLIGAGPGDYRLLTLRGKELLERADVIVYDHLADKRLLGFAPNRATHIYVGKESCNHTMKQEDISQLLVDEAKKGKIVVRLKGGDPLVFGRGAEEALLLRENNIPFEIVPGITSAIAVPAYSGIPITSRGKAVSFAVVTGHEDPHKEKSAIDWTKLSTAVDTLVFIMGVHNLPSITQKLMENGRPGHTPAAIISWGTTPEQRTLVTTVAEAAADAHKHGITPPAIFLVGSVVTLRDSLRWFDNKPLFGKRVLITRTRHQASALSKELEERGAACTEIPTIRIVEPSDGYASLDKSIAALHQYDWLIFTSVNGVDAFFTRLFDKGLDSRSLHKARIAVIGEATSQRLGAYGLHADVIPQRFHAEGLLTALSPLVQTGANVLLVRAREARSVLPDTLAARGAAVTIAEAYQTLPAEENARELVQLLKSETIDFITFTSSSTVKNLVSLLKGHAELLQTTKTACIGPVTADTCRSFGIEPTIVSDIYTIPALAEKIKEWTVMHHEA